MCGRFTLRTPMNQLAQQFLFEIDPIATPTLQPRYNIAPSQPVAAIRADNATKKRRLVQLRWGLIPSWAKEQSIGHKLINARAETVSEKPSFRSAFKHRRCLVLADGYYEWQKADRSATKQPYYIHMRDNSPFAFAAIWESWQPRDGAQIETCTIITTQANDLTKAIHPRMPVILPPDQYDRWLATPPPGADTLRALLHPYASDLMTLHPVATLVNNPRTESADCIVPLADGG